MTFEEYWKSTGLDVGFEDCAKNAARDAWEAGWVEGLVEGYDVGYIDTGMCPECLNEVQHKKDCGRLTDVRK